MPFIIECGRPCLLYTHSGQRVKYVRSDVLEWYEVHFWIGRHAERSSGIRGLRFLDSISHPPSKPTVRFRFVTLQLDHVVPVHAAANGRSRQSAARAFSQTSQRELSKAIFCL
jgi:hypothetical protein